MTGDKNLDSAMVEAFKHLRDVSVRDGVQSWDANKWKINDIVYVLEKINSLYGEVEEVAKKKDIEFDKQPIEAWGGGQFAQPAQFLSEDPFKNLEEITAAAPNLKIQALVRGRQCLGFAPVSEEVQTAAIQTAADKGVQVFRVFDMMNDIENVVDSFAAFQNAKIGHPELKIEGAVSYISEPEGGARAWEISEYADYALKLAKLGADEIAIKNYAGVGDAEMPDLVKAIKTKLNDNGYPEMKVNLHDHGQKPEVLTAALDAGADKVDVAIGELSGGPSHTNMRDMLHTMLEAQGFSVEDIDAHPVMQKLAEVEAKISEVVHRKDIKVNGKEEQISFDEIRAPLKNLTQEDMDKTRMAAGAVSDLLGKAKSFAYRSKNMLNNPFGSLSDEQAFKIMLNQTVELWEKAGRFNLVTPGAKIMVDQIDVLMIKKMRQEPISMADYTKEFKDVTIGRFGVNQGMEKGIGDVAFRDALLMYNALEVFNNAAEKNQVRAAQRDIIRKNTDFGNGNGEKVKAVIGKATFDLRDPKLEETLKINSKDTIERFKQAIQSEEANLPEDLKQKMLAELEIGRSKTPTTTLADGKENVDAFVQKDKRFEMEYMKNRGARISKRPDVELMSLLLAPDTFDKLLKNIANGMNVQVPEAAVGSRAI